MKKGGFSLVEVALAILLLSLGLVSIFALFPLGLQESDTAIQDTQEAMFVDYVFNTIEGNCLSITNWALPGSPNWNESGLTRFRDAALKGVAPDVVPGKANWVPYTGSDGASGWQVECITPDKSIEYPDPGALGFARYLRYRLVIKNADKSGTVKKVELEVKSGRYGNFDASYPQSYSTRVVFNGM